MKIFRYLMLSILPLVFLSCDNFEEEEFLTFVGEQVEESTPITKTQNTQTVLLEDYTGWKCVNCPAAAALLTELKTKYGENLMTMSVHAGSFAVPGKSNNNLDFRTEYGDKWNNEFGLSGYPIGVINRVTDNGSKAVQKDNWDSRIEALLSSTAHLMDINLGAEKKDGYFLVSAQYSLNENINSAVLVSVVVLEDGIIGVQLNSSSAYGTVPEIEDYSFNHVLRTNGQIDLPLFDNASSGDKIEKNYKINIDPSWNTDNCKVLVFVTDATTGEVIQSNEIDIK